MLQLTGHNVANLMVDIFVKALKYVLRKYNTLLPFFPCCVYFSLIWETGYLNIRNVDSEVSSQYRQYIVVVLSGSMCCFAFDKCGE